MRERREDIPALFRCFADYASETYDRPVQFLSSSEIALLMAHDWPGNVRELKNVAERVVLTQLPENERVTAAISPIHNLSKGASLDEQLQHFERQIIRTSLKRHKGRIANVMDELDVPRRTLNSKMTRLGIIRHEEIEN